MNYSNLMEAVNARVKANGRREITGDILNDVLRAIVVELGAGYQLGGIIRPGDKPKGEDLRVAYLAVEPGMYLYAGGFEVTELSLITYGAEWYMYPLGVPFGTQIAEDIAAAVEVEKMRAMAAEKVLSDEIDTETNERKAADTALDNDIKAEVTRATNAENANTRAIVNEASARKSADDALTTKIETEVSDRKAADQTLQDNINAEKTRATTAEATLTKNINTEAFERKAADTALDTRVTAIEDKIPAQASSENKLADKEFVNSSIATATATFRGTFETLEALKATTADKNDYAFWVHKDEDGNTCYDKYTYTGTEWKFEYRLNNSSFTAAQWAALNSGVTANVIKALQSADKANAQAVADEKAERIAAISAEATNREDADDALEEKITAETAERKAADQTLQENIDKKIFYIDYSRTAEGVYSSKVKGIDIVNALENKNMILLRRDDGLVSSPSTVDTEVNYIDIYWNDGPNDEGVWTSVEFIWNELNSVPDITEYKNLIWHQKQDVIPDLETIRTNAANGQTAFGWGDHAKAGYAKAFIINLSGDGSFENPHKVDKTREEVAAALAANSLILLKGGADGFSEIYPLIWATDYPTQAIMLQFGNIDEASLIYTTMVLVFSYQEGVGVKVMPSGIRLATDEQVKAKQDALVSGKNIKTINGGSVLGAGDLKVSGGLPSIQAGTGINSEVFNGKEPSDASGDNSHAEGIGAAIATGLASHAEGAGHANGFMAHAEGNFATANGTASHAEGAGTVATRSNSHAEGEYNVEDKDAIHSVGIGAGVYKRKDAHRITDDGKHYILGIGGFDGTKATANLTNEKDLATVINEMTPVILYYEGLGGNNEPIFVGEDGTALTRVQICTLLNGVNANRVVLKNKASAVMQTSSAKFLQCNANAFVIGFEGASAAGQIFDILYKWDTTAAKVLRAELLYNPTA